MVGCAATVPAVSERTALVTGGAGGIGGASAQALRSAGHSVVTADLDGADVQMDVTDPASVADGIAAAGALDILVNSAGWDQLMPFLDTDEDFWNRVIEINFKGCLRTTKAVLPGMVERGFGRIVNIASDAGRVGSSGESVYAGAKGAVIAFGKTVAREVATKGVTVNAVCPGPTRTPLLEGMAGEDERGTKLIAALERAVPMKRLGEPTDVAAAVTFLASDDASFITGQTLSVSGGLTMA
jgi:2-hydroxycyclohexanecarboxyl-CoA dehydrogenase